MTDEELMDAIDIGNALLHKRLFAPFPQLKISESDERQEWALHVTRYRHSYDRKRGKVSTWAYTAFRTWSIDRMERRIKLWENETIWDPAPAHDDERAGLDGLDPLWPEIDNGWTEQAEAILEHFPEKVRGSVRTHWGEGLSLTASADVLGISDRTISRHIAEARDFLAERPIELPERKAA